MHPVRARSVSARRSVELVSGVSRGRAMPAAGDQQRSELGVPHGHVQQVRPEVHRVRPPLRPRGKRQVPFLGRDGGHGLPAVPQRVHVPGPGHGAGAVPGGDHAHRDQLLALRAVPGRVLVRHPERPAGGMRGWILRNRIAGGVHGVLAGVPVPDEGRRAADAVQLRHVLRGGRGELHGVSRGKGVPGAGRLGDIRLRAWDLRAGGSGAVHAVSTGISVPGRHQPRVDGVVPQRDVLDGFQGQVRRLREGFLQPVERIDNRERVCRVREGVLQ